MVQFTIAGRPDCPFFVHTSYVATYLKSKLPNFKFEQLQFEGEDWNNFLRKLHEKHPNWHQTKSPIIWKTVSFPGGKEYLVGGINEFWEYCYDYYGLESIIPKEDLNKLSIENVELFQTRTYNTRERDRNKFRILITGAATPLITTLVPEILKLDCLCADYNGIIIMLQDDDCIDILNECIRDTKELGGIKHLFSIKIVETVAEGLQGTDMLLILNDYSNLSTENKLENLEKNIDNMLKLAEDIKIFSSRKLKILMAGYGPLCFNATTLLKVCPLIRSANIVVLSSDLGLGPLSFFCQLSDINVETVSGPPIWGLVGTNEFIDLGSAVQCYEMYLPYKRAISNKGGSTLSQGKIRPEMRFCRYLFDVLTDFWIQYEEHERTLKGCLEHAPTMAKTRAIVDLLEYWFTKSIAPQTKIISLGICSNGTFGIPTGLVFSQPVILENNNWKPCQNYPMFEATKAKVQALIVKSVNLIDNFSLKPNDYMSTETVYDEEFTI